MMEHQVTVDYQLLIREAFPLTLAIIKAKAEKQEEEIDPRTPVTVPAGSLITVMGLALKYCSLVYSAKEQHSQIEKVEAEAIAQEVNSLISSETNPRN
jgi:hypothetical protein